MILPIYINNHDWLTTTRHLAETLAAAPNTHVVIIDNNSTWQPLLDWYATCDFEVVKLPENIGHEAPWRTGTVLTEQEHKRRYGTDIYAVTDSDLDISDCPADLLDHLKEGFRRHPQVAKSGVSLRVDDLPRNEVANQVKKWEKQFWVKEADSDFYLAKVDTTLALWRASCRNPNVLEPALRSKPPYCAKHMPWYITKETLTPEQRHFLDNAGKCSTWGKKLRKACCED